MSIPGTVLPSVGRLGVRNSGTGVIPADTLSIVANSGLSLGSSIIYRAQSGINSIGAQQASGPTPFDIVIDLAPGDELIMEIVPFSSAGTFPFSLDVSGLSADPTPSDNSVSIMVTVS